MRQCDVSSRSTRNSCSSEFEGNIIGLAVAILVVSEVALWARSTGLDHSQVGAGVGKCWLLAEAVVCHRLAFTAAS